MYTCIAVFKMSTCYIKKEACCYNNKVKEMKKLEKPQKYSGLIETQCNLETFFLLMLFVENILNFYIKCIQASFSEKKNCSC